MKILVPLDGSDLSESVLGCAQSMARRWHAEVILVRVTDPFLFVSEAFSPGMSESMQRQIREAAADYLTNLLHHFEGLSVKTLSLVGSARDEIALAAEREECELIVMASHGHSGLMRWLLGSVAEGVMRISPCPVLLLRPPANQEFHHILVPIDGSEASLQVPHRVAAYLAPGGQLTLIRCSGLPVDEGSDSPAIRDYLEQLRENLLQVRVDGLQVEVVVMGGEAPEGILGWARDHHCDLVAMSTHGRSGLRHLWMGSVTEKVARHAPCPVLIFPPGKVTAQTP